MQPQGARAVTYVCVPATGNVKAANDFLCKLPCEWGPNAFANQVKGQRVQLPAGIYDPPYRINNENSQVTDPGAGPWESPTV